VHDYQYIYQPGILVQNAKALPEFNTSKFQDSQTKNAMAPNLNSKDYYEVLGCPRTADEAALKKAYRKLAVKVSLWKLSKYRLK
jgi:DnaJ-domain-containing protein 1